MKYILSIIEIRLTTSLRSIDPNHAGPPQTVFLLWQTTPKPDGFVDCEIIGASDAW